MVEDTASLQLVYESVLRNAGYDVVSASDAGSGSAAFTQYMPKVVVLDLMLPDRDGLDVMADILRAQPDTRVIVITANGSINKAVEAMRLGAYEFLVKPFDETRFVSAVENAYAELALTASEAQIDVQPTTAPCGNFIGTSRAMQDVYSRIRLVSRSMATVFITGESGTGKEICAQTIHDLSNRSGKPFIPLNCGAIPPDLLESEVFGHLKGSFTGAIQDKLGAAAAADGGTLFLDEICEMDLNLQTKLLRFLQTSTIQPVGETRPRKVNVRIICATNRHPLAEVKSGRFREDLYFRLQVVPIHLPPLRERGDDIIQIAQSTLAQLSAEEGRSFTRLSTSVQKQLLAMPWPGNVRQLQNVLRNVVVLNNGPEVKTNMLPPDTNLETKSEPQIPMAPLPVAAPPLHEAFKDLTMAEIERMVIEDRISRQGGSVPKAARALDLSPSTIYRKIDAWQKSQT